MIKLEFDTNYVGQLNICDDSYDPTPIDNETAGSSAGMGMGDTIAQALEDYVWNYGEDGIADNDQFIISGKDLKWLTERGN